jgi:putative RNA 2'-phosphotransferase
MNDEERKKKSKFLSLVLRHEPEKIGINLDTAGWAEVNDLLEGYRKRGKHLTIAELQELVATSDKKRFAFSPDGRRIRANQGHSVPVDLELPPLEPPEILYHGTATRFIDAIRLEGLISMSRQHVHLSLDVETAMKVGQRHGKPVILKVFSKQMHESGLLFFRADNGVWLTERVAATYIVFPN